jgi:uncharacterized repeat protein (TIGR03833 family)
LYKPVIDGVFFQNTFIKLEHMYMTISQRSLIQIGDLVSVVLKSDQRSGNLTEGRVQRILTNSPHHPHGIKVKLEDGQVGRVKEIH